MVVRFGVRWQMRHCTDQLIVCVQESLVLARKSIQLSQPVYHAADDSNEITAALYHPFCVGDIKAVTSRMRKIYSSSQQLTEIRPFPAAFWPLRFN